MLEPFRNNPAFGVIEAPPGVSGLGLYWNLDQGGPLADVRFRRACARAINYPTSFNLVRKEAFDAWYYTPGGVAGVIPTLQNKHAFVTGRKTGIQA